MKLTFLGGANEVGASCTLVQLGGVTLLVDAGVRPTGRRHKGIAADSLPDLSALDGVSQLDGVLITHAHADHTGALALVAQRFPGVPFFATSLTISLIHVMQADARRLMDARLDNEGELPLYDDVALEALVRALTSVELDTPLSLAPHVHAAWHHAGHIGGAAMISLTSTAADDPTCVLFTGDISLSPQRTVDAARLPANVRPDVVICESTYGGRLHANRQSQERQLVNAVADIVNVGGKVLIPAFALGRAQELMLTLAAARSAGSLPGSLKVYADGMIKAVSAVFTQHAASLSAEMQARAGVFFDGRTIPVYTQAERGDVLHSPLPAVVIASSGMLSGGASVEYARAWAPLAQHGIFLSGYQDEESPGRHLLSLAAAGGRGALQIGGHAVQVACRFGLYSLSAHADGDQLVAFLSALNPVHVLLVHGDGMAREALRDALTQRQMSVHLPEAGQSVTLFGHPTLAKPAPKSAPAGSSRTTPEPKIAAPKVPPDMLLQRARSFFPPEAPISRIGLADGSILLRTDYPLVFAPQHAANAREASLTLGIPVRIHLETNTVALGNLVAKLLAEAGIVLTRPPAFRREQAEIELRLDAPRDPRLEAVRKKLLELTGVRLTIAPLIVTPAPKRAGGRRMEINVAFAAVKALLAPTGLIKMGQAGEAIQLQYVTPEAAAKHAEAIAQAAQACGWPLMIAQSANQLLLAQHASEVAAAHGLSERKPPSIALEQRTVALNLLAAPGPASLQTAAAEFETRTGWRLITALPAANAGAKGNKAENLSPTLLVPVAQIRLSRAQRSYILRQDRLEAIMQQMHQDPNQIEPVQLTTVVGGYALHDGLYRLVAAKQLNMERIRAQLVPG